MARDRAGVLVNRGGATLMTLAKERRWRRVGDGTRIPVRWTGGKLDGDETFQDAAVRETLEEARVAVELVDAPRTFVARADAPAVVVEPTGPRPSPLLVRIRPSGGRSVSFLAEPLGEPEVGDVPGRLWVPFAALPLLGRGLPFARFAEAGIQLIGGDVPADAVAFLGATGTEDLMREVVERYGPQVLRSGDRRAQPRPEPAPVPALS